MLMNIRTRLPIGVLIALSIIVAGCGGGSKGERKMKDGRVFVQNDLGQPIRTSYLDEELGQVDTTIDPGEIGEATRRSMEGGTTVKLAVDVPGEAWKTLHVDVTIDGNVTVRVYAAAAWGAGDLDYEMR